MAHSTINNVALKKLEGLIDTPFPPDVLQNILRDLERIVYMEPKNLRALSTYAHYQLKNGRPDLAGEASSRVMQLSPHNIGGKSLLLRCYVMIGDNQRALEISKSLPISKISDITTLEILGNTLVFNEEYALAKNIFKKLTTIKPNNSNYHTNLGSMHHYCNEVDNAEKALIRACHESPTDFRAYWLLSQLRLATSQTNHIELLEKQLPNVRQGTDASCYLHFGLAKEYEDLKNFDKAFSHLKAGNAAKFDAKSYTIEDNRQLFSSIRKQYEKVVDIHSKGYECSEPIFIIGMPRSGTTLLEQVIGDDSTVFRAGELQDFYRAMCMHAGSKGGKWPLKKVLASAPSFDFKSLGKSYIELTRPRTGQTLFFIDKMPENFLYLGFINKALPNAKFIHISRDPLDTCLSNFKMLFGAEMYPYSYNMDTLAAYYYQYQKLMKYWNDAFGNKILNINYEDLIQDPTSQFSAIFQHCHLQWQEERLKYHQKNTPVGTASTAQVRQPIYTTSIKKWQKFEPHIAPLKQSLGKLGVI
jgi:tetratricopeptide (TPR) repeat protein|tara:strand:+ start:217 stop:1803 length:1587 start_codon:yes stop_codon:yes gene_type:complete